MFSIQEAPQHRAGICLLCPFELRVPPDRHADVRCFNAGEVRSASSVGSMPSLKAALEQGSRCRTCRRHQPRREHETMACDVFRRWTRGAREAAKSGRQCAGPGAPMKAPKERADFGAFLPLGRLDCGRVGFCLYARRAIAHADTCHGAPSLSRIALRCSLAGGCAVPLCEQ